MPLKEKDVTSIFCSCCLRTLKNQVRNNVVIAHREIISKGDLDDKQVVTTMQSY